MNKKNIEFFKNRIFEGDCLKIMDEIPDNSVDMVLCDLPYGTTNCKWDSVIPLNDFIEIEEVTRKGKINRYVNEEEFYLIKYKEAISLKEAKSIWKKHHKKGLWSHYNRIVKENGVVALTSHQIFTAELINSNLKNYKYKYVWEKSKATNFLNAKKQPLRKHEDICIFYKKQPTYNPQMTEGEAYDKGIRKNQNTGSYNEFNSVEVKSDGRRYPVDIVYFKTAESEGDVYHSTQKPVELGRYFIKTFTNEGDIILDNTCGSGSFLVAAKLENRNYIGIELNKDEILFKDKKVDLISICNKRLAVLDKETCDEVAITEFEENKI